MPLGLYLDNLLEWEDVGEKLGFEGQSALIINNTFQPDFKSRHTIQLWEVGSAEATIKSWLGESLAPDSLHEIYIKNTSNTEAKITFSLKFTLIDETTEDNSIVLNGYETAHLYGTGAYENGALKLVLRKGSQDTRK